MKNLSSFGEYIFEKMNVEVVNGIRDQIGNKAFYMMGAYNLVGDENWLSFRIKGSQKYNYIKVALNGMDTYDVTFMKLGKNGIINQETVEGVYNDMLHKTIEQHTGLYLKLF